MTSIRSRPNPLRAFEYAISSKYIAPKTTLGLRISDRNFLHLSSNLFWEVFKKSDYFHQCHFKSHAVKGRKYKICVFHSSVWSTLCPSPTTLSGWSISPPWFTYCPYAPASSISSPKQRPSRCSLDGSILYCTLEGKSRKWRASFWLSSFWRSARQRVLEITLIPL